MFTEEQEAYLEKMIDKGIERFFNRASKYLGVDPDNHEDVMRIREDFGFIRTFRDALASIRDLTHRSLTYAAGIGLVAFIAKISKHWFSNS